MDIAVKQRILGGVVLLAGAALFLPMLLEGSGVKALQPPELPAAPVTPTPADLAPPLQAKAPDIEAGVAASHADPTFYDVPPPQDAPAAVPTPAVPEQFHVVSPSAPAAPVAVQQPAKIEPIQADKPEPIKADKARTDKLAADKAAAAKKAADARVAAEKAAKAKADKLAADKAAADRKLADAKAEADRIARAAVPDPDPALPQAWVVQAGNFTARDKAQMLVDKLRGKGFRASLAGKDGGWRVIIGPELDKSLAEAAKKRLAADADLKVSGWIQAYRP